MKKQIVSFLVLAALGAVLATEPEAEGRLPESAYAVSGKLVTEFNFSDPTVWRDSHGGYLALASGMRRLLHSDDLFTWRDSGFKIVSDETYAALQKNTIGDGDGTAGCGLWAPDVLKVGTNWILTVTLRKSYQDSRIVSLVASRPEGPFCNPRELTSGLDLKIGDAIDPEVVVDGERVFLFFGSMGGVHYVELTGDARAVKTGAKPVHVAGHRMGFNFEHGQPSRFNSYEGTYVVKRGEWWYLFASGGRFRDWSYRIVVGRSRQVTGPYVDREGRMMTDGFSTTILASRRDDRFFGPGHNGEIFTKDGKEWMFYHVHDREIPFKGTYVPRPMMVQELKWDDSDWPYFVVVLRN